MSKWIIFLSLFINLISIRLFANNEYTVSGRVLDKSSGDALIGVQVFLKELRIGTTTNSDGFFSIHNIPGGTYTLRVSYLGFSTIDKDINVPSDDLQNLLFKLTESTIDLGEVIVTGNPFQNDPKDLSQITVSLSKLDLIVRNGITAGDALNFLPGIAMRSNGIATGRPVIRGFSNNKVLILEDGLRMGDLSSSSDDHSISDDGSEPEKIEVLEGPSSLLYGSNAIGGVINLITDAIPTYTPTGLNGEFIIQVSSVNNEYLSNLHLNYGSGNSAFHAKFFKRKGEDYKIPGGHKTFNSDLDSHGIQFGYSLQPEWGMSGLSYTYYNNKYGLPTLPSADEKVYIDMEKQQYRFQTDVYKINSFLKSMSLKAGYMDYKHKEISKTNGVIGTAFGMKTLSADLSFMHESLLGSKEGIIGIYSLIQDYNVEGEEALTPNAKYVNYAAYFLENYKIDNLHLSLGARYEFNNVKFSEAVLSDSLFGGDKNTVNTFSASLGLVYPVSENESFYLNMANAFRSPTVEELSSYSVHEALASFDIGNRSLGKENTVGFDLGFRSQSTKHSVDIDFYYNAVSGFIYRRPLNIFYNDNEDPLPGEQVGFNTDGKGVRVHEYQQADAVLYGFVAKFNYEILNGLQTTFISDYVRAKNTTTGENLPQIPPLRLSLELRYATPDYWFGGNWKVADKQSDVAPNEETTYGYGLLEMYAGIKIITGPVSNIFTLRAQNLLDQNYKDHLSAIKDFTYMPGRNIAINYRLTF